MVYTNKLNLVTIILKPLHFINLLKKENGMHGMIKKVKKQNKPNMSMLKYV